jgi:hypothetical protein
MAEVVNLSTGKPRDLNGDETIIALLESQLEAAKQGLIDNIIMYVERKDGFHYGKYDFCGYLKGLGMAQMMVSEIEDKIRRDNGDLTSAS